MLVACYTRVSTAEQVNEGFSLDEQAEKLQKYCSAMGWDVFNVYVDGGFSGANIKRPALEKLIKDVKAHKVEKVVVWKLDRLSRSQKDTLYLIEDVFLKNDCDFVSMMENFDTSTPFGRAMIGILAVFAQLEREQIKERMQMGKDAKAKQGLYHGYNNVPIGYKYIDGLLQVDENESQIVRKIFEMYAQGYSYSSIADFYNNAGLYPHYGNPWSRKVVRNLICSELYIGKIPHRGQWIDGIHQPIISRELWEQCERIRNKRAGQASNSQGINGSATAYLTGLIFCKHCGARYAKLTKIHTTKKNGLTHYSKYCCNSRAKRTKELIKDPNCKNKIWKMDELDSVIFAEIEKLALDPEYFEKPKKQAQKTQSNLEKQCLEQISKIEKQISKLMDLYSLGEMPVEMIQAKISDLHEQKTKLETLLVAESDEQDKSLPLPIAKEKIQSFGKVLEKGNFEDIRALLFLLIEKIELDNENVTIYWNF